MKCPQCGYTDEKAPASGEPADLARPNGLAAIKRVFGAPGDVPLAKARVSDEFKRLPYCANGTITVHKLLKARVEWVFAEIARQGLGACIKSYDGCYNPRMKRGGTDWSTHAWAIALDINAGENMPGMPNRIDKRVRAIFEQAGFVQLGGDPMHFQYCTGY
jgi:hypothetical protein